MKSLSGLDATFLYAETPTTPMNVIATVVVDGEVGFEAVVERMAERLPQLQPFRRRLVETPFGLDHPVWVDVPDLDVREHVTRAVAPEPGDRHALAEVVSRVARRRLDRARPLWEMVVVEGLADGRTALVVKTHHASVDGVAGAAQLLHLFDGLEAPRTATEADPEPTPTALLEHGLTRLLDRPGACWNAIDRTGRAAAQLAGSFLGPDAPQRAALPFQAPDSPWNAPLSSGRSIAYARSSLASIQRVRAAFGGTVNDVVLAACSRALRLELLDGGAAPADPLVAAVPVSTRQNALAGECGNRISALLASLPVQLEDPLHQLGEVQRSTRDAKRFHALMGKETLASLAELTALSPVKKALELYGRWRLAALHRPLVNLVLSNVPGPPMPLSFLGKPVHALHPHGPLMEGVGLNVTVMSYAGSIDVGVLACRERVPEAHRIADRVAEAIEELAKLAEASIPEVPPLARRVA